MNGTDLTLFKGIINKDQYNKYQVLEKKDLKVKEIEVFGTVFVFDYDTEIFQFSFDISTKN